MSQSQSHLSEPSRLDQMEDDAPPPGGLPTRRRFVWFVLATVALLLLVFLNIPAYDYDRRGLDLTSRTISGLWWTQLQGLPDVAYDGFLAVLFGGLMLAFIAGSGALLWYCLYPTASPNDDRTPVEPPSET